MSLMTMRRKMASKRTASIILWVLIAVFAVTAVFVITPGMFGKGTTFTGEDAQVIATVNGKEILAGDLKTKYAGDETTGRQAHYFTTALRDRQNAFDQLVQETVQKQAVKKMGVRLWSWTLRSFAKDLAEFQLIQIRDGAKKQAAMPQQPGSKEKPKTADEIYNETLDQAVKSFGVKTKGKPTEKDFIRGYVSRLLSEGEGGQRKELATFAEIMMLGEKVIKSLPASANPLSEAFVQKYQTKDVKAAWIFIAGKDNSAAALDEAKQKAQRLHDEIVGAMAKNPKIFAEKAKAESGDFMTRFSGGDLGWISGGNPNPQQQQPPVMAEYLAYTLNKGEISSVMLVSLTSPFGGPEQVGYAFAKVDDVRDRTDIKDPKAFNWQAEKASALLKTKFHFSSVFGQNYLKIEQARANIVRKTDELKYYEAQTKFDQKTMDALRPALLNDSKLPPEVIAAFKYEMLPSVEKNPAKKAEILSSIVSYAPSGEQTKYMLDLAQAYVDAGQKDKASEQLENIADSIETGDQDTSAHERLKTLFKKVGDTQNVQRMAEWLKAHPKPKAPAGGMPMGMPMSMPQ